MEVIMSEINMKNIVKKLVGGKKGFTIIELIIVIAIIAVLAAMVLINVTQYITKGRDAAIKGNIDSIIKSSAVWFDNNNNDYTGFDAEASYIAAADAITNAGKTVTPATAADGTAFCACATLYDTTGGDNTFCADSSGYKNQTNTDCDTRCDSTTPTGVCTD